MANNDTVDIKLNFEADMDTSKLVKDVINRLEKLRTSATKILSEIIKSFEGWGDKNGSTGPFANASFEVAQQLSGLKQSMQGVSDKIGEVLDSTTPKFDLYGKKLESLTNKLKEVQHDYQTILAQRFAKNDPQLSEALKAEKAGTATEEQLQLTQQWHQDLREANAALRDTQSQIDALAKSEAELNAQSDQMNFEYIARMLEPLSKEVAQLSAEYENLKQTAVSTVSEEVTEGAQKLQQTLDRLSQKSNKMSVLGATDKSWKNLVYDAELVYKAIEQSAGAESQVAQNAKEALNIIRQQAQTGMSDNAAAQAEKVAQKQQQAADRAKEHGKQVDKLHSKYSSWGKSSSGIFKNIRGGFNDLERGFKRLLKRFMMFGLGFRSTYFMIKRLRKVFIESFKEMAKQIPELAGPVNNFYTALNQIKGSLATAFQPIASVILPILTQFINTLSKALNVVGEFFATLTGQGYIYEFTADQVTNMGDETAKAAKKVKKSLAPFDEINQLSSNDSSSDSSGSGTTGTYKKVEKEGAASNFAKMLKEAWDKEDFTSVGEYIGDKIKTALDNATANLEGKYHDMATKIARSLAQAINGIVKTPGLGTSIGNFAGAFVNLIVDTIYDFVSTVDWSAVGQFIADSITAFFRKVKWDKAAQTLSTFAHGLLTALKTALKETDWGEVGRSIGEFISNIDWTQLTLDLLGLAWEVLQALAQAFYGLAEKSPIVAALLSCFGITKLANLVLGAFGQGSVGSILTGIAGQFLSVKGAVSGLNDTIDVSNEVLGKYANTGTGKIKMFASNVSTKLSGIASALGSTLSKMGGALKAFFISPAGMWVIAIAAVVAAIALVIKNWDSIKEAGAILWGWIKDFAANVKGKIDKFADDWSDGVMLIKTKIDDVKNKVNNVWTSIKSAFKKGANSVIGVLNGLLSSVAKIINKIFELLNKIKIDIPDWVPKYGGKTFGFNLKPVQATQIPYLAKGTVVPPNKQFLAMLGDNKKETEVVSPLSTMKQALSEVLTESGFGSKIDNIVIYLSTADVTRAVVTEINGTTKQTGTCPIKLVRA